jgi:peptidoglycan-associated lipoprotein
MQSTTTFTAARAFKLALAVAATAFAAACSTPVELDKNAGNAPVESRTPGAGGQSSVATVDTSKNAGAGSGASTIPANFPRTIYFDFDSYVVKDEFRPVIEQYAKQLVTDRKLKIAIEGHTDERGGREYNLALGQKRAEAVTKALMLLGAQEAQVEATSYGKERPAVNGAGEDAYSKNRRAEMKDR